MDHSLPGSSVHGILQARILEWVAIPFSRGSSQPRDQTLVSCIAGRFFTVWDTRKEWRWHKIRGRDISWESLIVNYINTSQILTSLKSRWSGDHLVRSRDLTISRLLGVLKWCQGCSSWDHTLSSKTLHERQRGLENNGSRINRKILKRAIKETGLVDWAT